MLVLNLDWGQTGIGEHTKPLVRSVVRCSGNLHVHHTRLFPITLGQYPTHASLLTPKLYTTRLTANYSFHFVEVHLVVRILFQHLVSTAQQGRGKYPTRRKAR